MIISCHNYGRYLGWTINSVLRQTYQNVEIIVINDGSKDCTASVLQKLRNKVRVVHYPDRMGCGIARNQGLKLATGELCLFLDADDFLESSYLEKTVPLLFQSRAGVVYCSYFKLYPDGHRVLCRAKSYHRQELLKENFMAITSLTRTELVKRVGGFDNRLLVQDYDLWLRITHIARAVEILEPLFVQNIHGHNMSLTTSFRTRRVTEMERVQRRSQFGLFLRHAGSIHLVTSKQIRHAIIKSLLYEAELDGDDVFEVDSKIMGKYLAGPPIFSLEGLFQTAQMENQEGGVSAADHGKGISDYNLS